ncbi:EpsG family protein [Pedobacter nototheniae]|uniref:EpsG family protein n=1 Tax=Pedobacter nototheniae TaxID=2488994 RepID=UPI0013F3C6A2|nr:EpsG family protein [Pedobacter nototheniae]
MTLFQSDRNTKIITFFIVFIVLSIFAGTRTMIVGRDYEEYYRLFSFFPTFKSIEGEAFVLYEPTILLLPQLSKFLFGSDVYLNATFLLFSILGVGTKLYSIQKSKFFFLSTIIYCSYLFYSQEMITIRAGVACGLFLLAIDDLENKNDKRFFLKIGIAYLFHYSSFIFIFVWIIERFNIRYKLLYIGIGFSLIIALLKINILTLLKLDAVFPKVKIYLALLESESDVPVNILNFRILFSLLFLALFVYKIELVKNLRMFPLLFKVHLLSIILFFTLSPTAMVFSLRIFDMLSVGQILLYPFVIYLFKEKVIGYLIILIFCIINFYYIFFISGWFVNGYESWLF